MKHVRPRIPTAFTFLLLCLFLLGSSLPASAVKEPQAKNRRANARKLLRIADGASRQLIQSGQGRLDRDARSRAFWEALLHMDAQIDRVGAGLRTRDLSFFQALRTGTASLAELQVTWALAGIKDPVVDQNLRVLAAAYGRLRHRYGPDWVRYQAGRPLSEDERLRFARMRAEQGLLADRIEPLRDRAARAGDHATVDELTLLLAQIHAVATASATLGDYLDASVATDSIRGAWHGARASHATDEPGWAEADQVVSDITTDEGVGFVFTTDLSSVKDWSFVEEETEVPAEIAQVEEAGDRLAPGQIVDLGAIEEVEEAEPSDDPTDRSDPTEPSDLIGSEEAVEEPEVLILDEELPAEAAEAEPGEVIESTEPIEPIEESPGTEPLPAEETFEEEDLEVEALPEAAPPPPPAAAPESLPIG